MSQKRAGKLLKRARRQQKERRRQEARLSRLVEREQPAGSRLDQLHYEIEEELVAVYPDREEVQADLILVEDAWRAHTSGEEGEADTGHRSLPPFFEIGPESIRGMPWMATFRDRMVEKYGSLEAAEPRMRALLTFVAATAITAGSGSGVASATSTLLQGARDG